MQNQQVALIEAWVLPRYFMPVIFICRENQLLSRNKKQKSSVSTNLQATAKEIFRLSACTVYVVPLSLTKLVMATWLVVPVLCNSALTVFKHYLCDRLHSRQSVFLLHMGSQVYKKGRHKNHPESRAPITPNRSLQDQVCSILLFPSLWA